MIADAINGAIARLYLLAKREDGQTFVEYSLIGVLVALVLAAALVTLQGDISGALGAIGDKLKAATP